MLNRIACLSAIITLASFTPLAQQSKSVASKKASGVKASVKERSALELLEGKVIDVLEGDTITVFAKNGTFSTVRIQGIDAPDNKQNYFKKSKKSLSELIEDKEVKVLTNGKDAQDRYVGSVYFEGRDVGLMQIERGMAWHYKYAAATQTTDVRKKYAQAQETAMSSKLGLWEDSSPKAPWDFRGEAPPAEVQKADISSVSAPVDTSGRKYLLGPRGGCYYVSESGRKVYVKDKSLCGATETEKP
jgi:endonuclease YncB( thermonuclease family)